MKSAVLFLFVSMATLSVGQTNNREKIRTLMVFFDGLRPDYITPVTMPNLYAFSKEGCYGKKHHSVFPTVTRVNASSLSTGTYPETHGVLGNTVFFPEINATEGLNTGDYQNLDKISTVTRGRLLTSTTLGEVLGNAGERMMVFSSGSTGQAFLQNHTLSGGAIINPELILPQSFEEKVIKEIGPPPANSEPNIAQHKWITDALIKYALATDGPLVSTIWYSDPDGVAHSDGIGAVSSMESIRLVDAEFGRILQALKAMHLTDKFNIIVSSDHGFVTNVGNENLGSFLIKQGLKEGPLSEDVVLSGKAIYVKDHNPEVIRSIVLALQGQEWIGAIFTRPRNPGDIQGWIEGTLSFASIHWNHPERSADILVDENWDDRKNDYGYVGASFAKGVAGHGGLSPYEVHIALLVSGPSFKRNFESELPTSNVDIVPTILAVYKMPIPASMKGRVMNEFFKDNNRLPGQPKKEKLKTTAHFPGGVYTLTLERTILGKYQYVDFARVKRTVK
jgi:arylsulfatase A-like enzyme